MGILNRPFEIEIAKTENTILEELKTLIGWQINQGSWQQGRYRTLTISGETFSRVSLVTSFVGIISLVRADFRVEAAENSDNSILIGEVRFSAGVFFFLVFLLTMLSAVLFSKYGLIVKSIYSALIVGVAYGVLTGIFRDRENLLNDLLL